MSLSECSGVGNRTLSEKKIAKPRRVAQAKWGGGGDGNSKN